MVGSKQTGLLRSFGALVVVGCFVMMWGMSCSDTSKVEEPAKERVSNTEVIADASTGLETPPTREKDCQPGVEECNGKDDDCDGSIDEDLNCPKEGDTRECYSGALDTKGKGECKAGTQTYQKGAWGACEGEIKPGNEECNDKDDDCDGQIDEELSRICKSDCGDGKEVCKSGSWEPCDAPKPAKEECNGKDDNCDGKIDEGCSCKVGDTQPCGSDEGSCKKGKQSCADGKWGGCEGEIRPGKEECNGKDDDCDGQIDEELTRGCYSGPAGTDAKGICTKGKQSCSSGQWGTCQGEILPGKEVCNGKDDDCNGNVDEGLSELQCGKGSCLVKISACTNGTPNVCKPNPPKQEVCNGKDDDCDGAADNGATCPAGQACVGGVCKGTGPAAYRTGNFQSPGNYTVVGKVSLFKTSGGERIEFDANFSSSSGPDLVVYLVKASNGAVSGQNFISLGPLKNTKGTQTYTLNQASTGFMSIVVWCKLARVNFGYANLSP